MKHLKTLLLIAFTLGFTTFADDNAPSIHTLTANQTNIVGF